MVRENQRAIKNGQSIETGNKTKQNKNSIQYVFDITIRKQTQIT